MPTARSKKPLSDSQFVNPTATRTSKHVKSRPAGPATSKKAATAAIAFDAGAAVEETDAECFYDEMDVEPLPIHYQVPDSKPLIVDVTTPPSYVTNPASRGVSNTSGALRATMRGLYSSSYARRATEANDSSPHVDTQSKLPVLNATWQNAGARHLRNLPPEIAADLCAITIQSAARVIAGLPVFYTPSNGKASNIHCSAAPTAAKSPSHRGHAKKLAPTIITNSKATSIATRIPDAQPVEVGKVRASPPPLFAAAARKGSQVPALPKKTIFPPSQELKPDARDIIRVPSDHPL